MKQFFQQITGVITILLFITACSSPKEKEKKDDIGEPNNSILEAGLLDSGKPYQMKIDTIGDVDWFAVPVDGPGYLNLSTKNIPENLKLVVRFAKKQEWEQQKEKWITGEMGFPATIPIEEPDTIYFVFKDKYNNNAAEENIEFKADFIEEFDEYESNNIVDSAKTVATGESVKSYFYPPSDVDWFKTEVDTSGYLMIQARSLPENIKVEARFAKKPDDFSKAEYISGGMGLPAAIQVTDPGEYYFYLKDKYNSNMSKDPAEWKVEFVSEIDTTEPNNDFDTAYQLAVNDTVRTAIFPKGDQNYFTFTPKMSGELRLATKHPKELKPEIKLFAEKDFEAEPIGKWQVLPTNIEVEADQKYYIQLHTKYDNAYSKEPMLFMIIQLDGQVDAEENGEEKEE